MYSSNSDDGNRSDDSNAGYSSPMDTESDGDNNAGIWARPARKIQPNQDPSFVRSGEIQFASSSPQADSSHGASSTSHIDNVEHQLRVTVEEDTLRLISYVIRHVLYFGSPQDQDRIAAVIDFRDIKLRAIKHLPSVGLIKATDNRGLYLRIRNAKGAFRLRNDRVAILEAKRKF